MCPHPTLAKANKGVCPLCGPDRDRSDYHTHDQIKAELCRRSFARFVREAWPHIPATGGRLRWNWHIQAVCDHEQAIIDALLRAKSDESYTQDVRDLVINVPPRSLKSIITSVLLPAWVWTSHPEITFRCLSSSEKLVLEHARASRELMDNNWYRNTFGIAWQWNTEVAAAGLFANDAGGFRASQPWLSKITGTGSDVMIIDDPHDVSEAGSEVKREAVTSRWSNTIANRVSDPTRYARIGIMQRVHELDWTGHVLSGESEWKHLRIPQEFEADNPCETWLGWRDPRKTAGDLLFPEWFPAEWVAKEKRRLGSYQYAGQHQQRPAPAEGGMFKQDWFRSFELHDLPKLDDLVLSLDPAAKKTDHGSNYAWVLIGKRKHQFYVIDVLAARMEFDDALKRCKELCAQHEPRKKIIEPKAAGPALTAMLRSEIRAPIIEIEPQGDKTQRAQACLPVFEAGNVLLLKGAPWREQFIHELCTFPMGARDDIVDATTQAINHMMPTSDLARARMLCS